MAYTARSKSKGKNDFWAPMATAKATEILFGVKREFTVYAASKFNNVCSATQATISRGEPIAYYLDDNGNKKYTVWPIPDSAKMERQDPFANFQPDSYKVELYNALINTQKHISVLARAGSGKTKGFCWAITKALPKIGKVAAMAFGVKDAAEMKRILPESVTTGTSHSLSFAALKSRYPKLKFNKNKLDDLLNEVCGEGDEQYHIRNVVENIVSKCKYDAVVPGKGDALAIRETINNYEINVPASRMDEIVDYVRIILKKSMSVATLGVDYDDQIWLAAITDIQFDHFDVVCVDECQDFSRSQLIIVSKLIDAGARIVAVGDDWQAMYEFRGARADSFEQIRNLLICDKRGAELVSMPICYRCSKAVLKQAQLLVPDIQARPDAPEGFVGNMSHDDMMATVDAGDAIVCRINRPIIKIAHDLLEQQREFAMLGGDIEAAAICGIIYHLTWHIGKHDVDAKTLQMSVRDWLSIKSASVTNEEQLEIYEGRAGLIDVLCDFHSTAGDVIAQIRKIFKPTELASKILLGTIHRMKGSEANRVWIVRPDLIPHPKAKTLSEKQQELHGKYVAETRAKLELYYVPYVKPDNKKEPKVA